MGDPQKLPEPNIERVCALMLRLKVAFDMAGIPYSVDLGHACMMQAAVLVESSATDEQFAAIASWWYAQVAKAESPVPEGKRRTLPSTSEPTTHRGRLEVSLQQWVAEAIKTCKASAEIDGLGDLLLECGVGMVMAGQTARGAHGGEALERVLARTRTHGSHVVNHQKHVAEASAATRDGKVH